MRRLLLLCIIISLQNQLHAVTTRNFFQAIKTAGVLRLRSGSDESVFPISQMIGASMAAFSCQALAMWSFPQTVLSNKLEMSRPSELALLELWGGNCLIASTIWPLTFRYGFMKAAGISSLMGVAILLRLLIVHTDKTGQPKLPIVILIVVDLSMSFMWFYRKTVLGVTRETITKAWAIMMFVHTVHGAIFPASMFRTYGLDHEPNSLELCGVRNSCYPMIAFSALLWFLPRRKMHYAAFSLQCVVLLVQCLIQIVNEDWRIFGWHQGVTPMVLAGVAASFAVVGFQEHRALAAQAKRLISKGISKGKAAAAKYEHVVRDHAGGLMRRSVIG